MSDRVLADELLREEALELLRLSRPQWYAAYQANVVEDRLQQAVARELRVKQGTVSKWVGKARREVDDYVERRKRGEATSPQPVARDLLGLARATGLSKDDLARIVLGELEQDRLVGVLRAAGVDVLGIALAEFQPTAKSRLADLLVDIAVSQLRPKHLYRAFWRRNLDPRQVGNVWAPYGRWEQWTTADEEDERPAWRW